MIIVFALTLAVTRPGHLNAAEFSAEATALPFPPDARDLEFVAWVGAINYTSQSPLKSLAAFYLKEMASRGWEHDESAAEIDKDSIKLKFKHDRTSVKVDLRQGSKEVRVSLDCEKMQFNGSDDPAKLAAAGIPAARSALFVQRELPLPEVAVNLQYTGEGCTFKSPLSLQEAFDHFMKLAPRKGFRESRRPIVTDTRRYTEFKKGSAQLNVNVFTDAVGSRVILTYKDETREPTVPPLAAVALLPIKVGAAKDAESEATAAPVGATPIDVTNNKGSASISYAGKQYTFNNVAAFRTKRSDERGPMVVFSAKPIPFQKMQSLISAKDDFSFNDLYDFSAPDRLIVELGDYLSCSFALSSTFVSHSVDNPVNEMKVEWERVRGTMKMPPKEIFKGEQFSFTATVDAVIVTPRTRITGPGDPIAKSDSSALANAPVPFPDGVENASSEGSKFRKTYKAVIRKPLAEVSAFYRQELAAKGWKLPDSNSGGAMRMKNDKTEVAVTLRPQGSKTVVEVFTRDLALAKQEGIAPEPGKGRLVLGNANDVAVVFSIGNVSYSLKAERGAKDYTQTVSQSLAPGTYTVILKAPGQSPQSEKIDLTEGSTWGIIALPRGGCLPVQLY
jgi:hypothetical protein